MKHFSMKYDALCRIRTTLFFVALLGCVAFLAWRSSGTYLPAWFAIITSSVVLLVLMSAPRRVIISKHNLELHSLLNIKTIPLDQVTHVGFTSVRRLRPYIPLWGVFGFFGYYGYYYSFKRKGIYKFFATNRKRLVEVCYGDEKKCLVVSVKESREFVRILQNKIDKR